MNWAEKLFKRTFDSSAGVLIALEAEENGEETPKLMYVDGLVLAVLEKKKEIRHNSAPEDVRDLMRANAFKELVKEAEKQREK